MAQWRNGLKNPPMPSPSPASPFIYNPPTPVEPPSPTLTNPDMILPDPDPVSLSPDTSSYRTRGRLVEHSPSRALTSHPISINIPSPIEPELISDEEKDGEKGDHRRKEVELDRYTGFQDVVPSSPTLPPALGSVQINLKPGSDLSVPSDPLNNLTRRSITSNQQIDGPSSQERPSSFQSSSHYLEMPSHNHRHRVSGDSISTGIYSDNEGPVGMGGNDGANVSRTPAALSRRAEQILAHAKQSLDNMQGNLNKARHSMIFASPPPEDHDSPSSFDRPLKTSMSLRSDRSQIKPWTTSYTRRSQRSPSSQLSSISGFQDRQSSTSPAHDPNRSPISPMMYFRPNRSPVPLRLRQNGSVHDARLSKTAENAETTSMHDDQATPDIRRASPRSNSRATRSVGQRAASPGSEHSKSTEPTSTSPGLDELRSQMTELRGRIVSLKQRATEESARRRSVASRKTPSPLNAADEWQYTRERTSSASSNSPEPVVTQGTRQKPVVVGPSGGQQLSDDDREDSPVVPLEPLGGELVDIEDGPPTSDDPDEIEQYLLMRENRMKDEFRRLRMEGMYTEETRQSERNFRNQYAVYRQEGLIRDDELYDLGTPVHPGGDRPFDDPEVEEVGPGASHEDRADAFDYEKMFLYSSNVQAYPTPPSEASGSSDTSERTTRVASTNFEPNTVFPRLPASQPSEQQERQRQQTRPSPSKRAPSGADRPRKPSNDISQLHVRSSSICSTSTFQSFATANEDRIVNGFGGIDMDDDDNDESSYVLGPPSSGLRIQTNLQMPGPTRTADGISIPHANSAWLDAATPVPTTADPDNDLDDPGTPTQTHSLNPPEPWNTSVLLRQSGYTSASASPRPATAVPAVATELRASVASTMMPLPIMRPGDGSTPSLSPRTLSLPSSLGQKEGALHRPLLGVGEEGMGVPPLPIMGASAGATGGRGHSKSLPGGAAEQSRGVQTNRSQNGDAKNEATHTEGVVPTAVLNFLIGGLLEGVQRVADENVLGRGLKVGNEDLLLVRGLCVRIGSTLVGLDSGVGRGTNRSGVLGNSGFEGMSVNMNLNKFRADVAAATAMLK